jgi:hypothetical protein
MKNTIIACFLTTLLMPIICFAGAFSVAIKYDPEFLKYHPDVPKGPWTFIIDTRGTDVTINCDG